MITTADLKSHTKADLTKMAKRLGIVGCSGMRKDDLVKAVAKASRNKSPAKSKATTKSSRTTKAAAKKATASNGRGENGKATAKTTPKTNGSPRRKTAASPKAAKAASPRSNARKTTKSTKKAAASSRLAAPKKLVESQSKKPSSSKSAPKSKVAGKSKKTASKKAPPKATSPKVLKRIRELQLQKESSKDVSFQPTLIKPPGATEPIWEKEPAKDRVSLFVRDAYWLHASWDITRSAVERARAALAEYWHTAQPILRLLRMDETGTTAETIEREIPIHGGLRDWYIDLNGDPATFRVMVGYTAGQDRFSLHLREQCGYHTQCWLERRCRRALE